MLQSCSMFLCFPCVSCRCCFFTIPCGLGASGSWFQIGGLVVGRRWLFEGSGFNARGLHFFQKKKISGEVRRFKKKQKIKTHARHIKEAALAMRSG